MNSLLVLTPQPEYLDEAKKWIERLDKAGADGAGIRFYIYHVQNGRAERIGPLLQQVFTGRITQSPLGAGPPTLAPGTPAGTIVSPPAFQPGAPMSTPQTVVTQTQTQTPTPTPTGAPPGTVQSTIQRVLSAAEGIGVVRNIQVVADKTTQRS